MWVEKTTKMGSGVEHLTDVPRQNERGDNGPAARREKVRKALLVFRGEGAGGNSPNLTLQNPTRLRRGWDRGKIGNEKLGGGRGF